MTEEKWVGLWLEEGEAEVAVSTSVVGFRFAEECSGTLGQAARGGARQRDGRHVDAGLEQAHGGCVADDVWRHAFRGQARTSLRSAAHA